MFVSTGIRTVLTKLEVMAYQMLGMTTKIKGIISKTMVTKGDMMNVMAYQMLGMTTKIKGTIISKTMVTKWDMMNVHHHMNRVVG